MKALLDTHFLLWLVLDHPRIDAFPWIERYRPWNVSPVTFLEVQFLGEVGRLEVRASDFVDAVGRDPRFIVDEIPMMTLIGHALTMSWTRDPFDRLLAAHSQARRLPLCTLDPRLREEHRFVVGELAERA